MSTGIIEAFERQRSSRPPSASAAAMADKLEYWQNRPANVNKFRKAKVSIKACRRYFSHLDITPRSIRFYGFPGVTMG